jgi:hypothetical protein
MLRPGGRVGEAECRVLDLPVGRGEATAVLSQMFLPRGDAEDLDESVRTIPVPVQRPACGTGSTSGLTQVFHRLEKVGARSSRRAYRRVEPRQNQEHYTHDPDGNEFEVKWMLPKALWGEYENAVPIDAFDLARELLRWAVVPTAVQPAVVAHRGGRAFEGTSGNGSRTCTGAGSPTRSTCAERAHTTRKPARNGSGAGHLGEGHT